MSKIKELFTSMMQGLMDGVSVEKQLQRKYRDDDHRVTLFKSEPSDEDRDKINEVEQAMKDNSYGEELENGK